MTTPTAQAVNDLLERGYQQAARQVLTGIAAEIEGGVVGRRLADLEDEAFRLEEAGERLRPDNAVLRAVLADLEVAQRRNQQRIQDAAGGLTEAGVQAGDVISWQLTFAGMSDNAVARIGAAWNRADPEAVASLVDFTQDSAFGEMLRQYGGGVLQRVQAKVTVGFVNGWSARRSAREIVRLAAGMPLSEAQTITRTLHLVSYRRGTAATHAANAHMLQAETIRVAVLDARTCLACVALHGSKIPLGEPVADHWQGRCTALAQVKGMGRVVTAGPVWFAGLDEARQREQYAFRASPGAYDAFRDGAVTLNDFVREGSDALFGEMIYQQSLKGALGDDARRYYRR